MATIIGTSGAWKSVCRMLNRENLNPEKPSDIRDFLNAIAKEYTSVKTKATQDLTTRIENFRKKIEHHEQNFDVEVQIGKDKISAKIKETQSTLQSLQNGIIQKIFSYFRIRKEKDKLKRLKYEFDNYPKLLQRKINKAKNSLKETQNNFDVIIEKQCQPIANKVMFLKNALKSPDLAGGIAELELIENLRSLPNNFFVISDVRIASRRAIHFDGDWLKSAQIDHLVVTPSGIFVIEVKNWSTKFAQDGDYFDPYQQVKRSSYLCYKFIGKRYNLKTRSIIAYKGSIPKKPSDSYTKVLPISEVKAYISWFKDANVSNQVVELVANLFVG